MGKRRRKINNPKFATKFAKTRETYLRLKGIVTDTIETAVDNLTETVDTVVEEIKETFKEPETKPNALKFINEDEILQVEEPAVEVVEKPKPKTTRKKAATKKTTTTKAAPKKTTPSTTKKTTTTTRRRRTTKTKTSA